MINDFSLVCDSFFYLQQWWIRKSNWWI